MARYEDPGTYEPFAMQPYWSSVEESQGLPYGFMRAMAGIESQGGKNLRSGTGATGPFQFTGIAAKEIKVPKDATNDPFVAAASAAALANKNREKFVSEIGREPTGFELYMMHQQGAEGALAALGADANTSIKDTKFGSNIIKQGVKGFTGDTPVGDFVDLFRQKYAAHDPSSRDAYTSSNLDPEIGNGLGPIFNSINPMLPGVRLGPGQAADFDRNAYLAQNQDLAAAGVDPWQHYNQFGRDEGRAAPLTTSAMLYQIENPDIADAGIDPWTHFKQFGQKEGRRWTSPQELYRFANPDIGTSDPLEHYQAYGQNENRQWSGTDDPAQLYLMANQDLAAAGVDPVKHWQEFGRNEGREWFGPGTGDDYLRQFDNVPSDWAKGGLTGPDTLVYDPQSGRYNRMSGPYPASPPSNYDPVTGSVRGAQPGFPSAADLNGFPSQQWTPPVVPDVSANPAAAASAIPIATQGVSPDWQVPSFGNPSFPGGVFGALPLGGSGVSPSTVGPSGVANPFGADPNISTDGRPRISISFPNDSGQPWY